MKTINAILSIIGGALIGLSTAINLYYYSHYFLNGILPSLYFVVIACFMPIAGAIFIGAGAFNEISALQAENEEGIRELLDENKKLLKEKKSFLGKVTVLIFFLGECGIPEKEWVLLGRYVLGFAEQTDDEDLVGNCAFVLAKIKREHIIDEALGNPELDPKVKERLIVLQKKVRHYSEV